MFFRKSLQLILRAIYKEIYIQRLKVKNKPCFHWVQKKFISKWLILKSSILPSLDALSEGTLFLTFLNQQAKLVSINYLTALFSQGHEVDLGLLACSLSFIYTHYLP